MGSFRTRTRSGSRTTIAPAARSCSTAARLAAESKRRPPTCEFGAGRSPRGAQPRGATGKVSQYAGLRCSSSEPGIFAELVSISSARSAGGSDSAYLILSVELRPTLDLFLGAHKMIAAAWTRPIRGSTDCEVDLPQSSLWPNFRVAPSPQLVCGRGAITPVGCYQRIDAIEARRRWLPATD